MKLVVIGFGQCGGRIADEFARWEKSARAHRGISIVPAAFAVNTDIADLTGLSHIKSDFQHRILIGNRRTGGHGVGKINEVGAEIAHQDSDKIIDAVGSAERFYESDAFLLIAGAAGGTGSGSMPITAKSIRERYPEKPIYTLLVLPFEHEEGIHARTVHNTATCVKATYSVADAVFLVDNQRYIAMDSSLVNNMEAINRLIAEPFFDLLCAGEEKKPKNIGAKLLDAGDIEQTLGGWSVLGFGKSQLPAIRLPFERNRNFRKKSSETHKGLQAMDQAFDRLSLRCNPQDAGSALYLLSAPRSEMNMNLVKELGEHLHTIAPDAIIRYGDYPRGTNALKITLIFSQMKRVDKVRHYYEQMPKVVKELSVQAKDSEEKLKELVEAAEAVPSLFSGNGN